MQILIPARKFFSSLSLDYLFYKVDIIIFEEKFKCKVFWRYYNPFVRVIYFFLCICSLSIFQFIICCLSLTFIPLLHEAHDFHVERKSSASLLSSGRMAREVARKKQLKYKIIIIIRGCNCPWLAITTLVFYSPLKPTITVMFMHYWGI